MVLAFPTPFIWLWFGSSLISIGTSSNVMLERQARIQVWLHAITKLTSPYSSFPGMPQFLDAHAYSTYVAGWHSCSNAYCTTEKASCKTMYNICHINCP